MIHCKINLMCQELGNNFFGTAVTGMLQETSDGEGFAYLYSFCHLPTVTLSCISCVFRFSPFFCD